MYNVLLITIGFVGYIVVAAFVFGCARSLIKNDELETLTCAAFWPIVVPLYILYSICESQSNFGFYFTERRLIKLSNKLNHQKQITQELENLEKEIDRVYKNVM